MKRGNIMKRLLVMALAVVMAFSCVFLTAFANEQEEVAPACAIPDCDIPDCEEIVAKDTVIKLSGNPLVVAYDGERHGVEATLLTTDGEYVKDAKVTLVYAGVNNDGVVDDYTSILAPSDIGIYQVIATFEGNAYYKPATASAVLVIHDYWAELSKVVFEEPVKVVEYNGKPQRQVAEAQNLLGKKIGDPVIFYFNGAYYTTKAPVAPGVYSVIAVYSGDSYYAASYNLGKLIIECPEVPEEPTVAPTDPEEPTVAPTDPEEPTVAPTDPEDPTVAPTDPEEPTVAPTDPEEPTVAPTDPEEPTVAPTDPEDPTVAPTDPEEPTVAPTDPEEPTVAPTDPETDNPQTGDFNVMFMWVSAMMLSLVGIVCVVILMNKKVLNF